MKTTVAMVGLRDMDRALKRVAKRYPQIVANALYVVGLELGRAIFAHPIPWRDGVLARSIYVTQPQEKGRGGWVLEVGVNTVYARRQHEEHRTRRYYIKQPADALKATFARDVNRAAQALLRSNNQGGRRGRFPVTPPGRK